MSMNNIEFEKSVNNNKIRLLILHFIYDYTYYSLNIAVIF